MRVAFPRVGLGLAAMGCLAWLLWPDSEWGLEPEPAFSFVVALCIWLWREFTGGNDTTASQPNSELMIPPAEPHPNDISISNNFLQFFSSEVQSFLRAHDLGAAFPYSIQSLLMDAADRWRGPHWEYEDKELKDSFSKFNSELSNFTWRLIEEFEPIGQASNRVRIICSAEERMTDFFSNETRARVDELNAMSSHLYELGTDHLRLIRQKMPKVFATAMHAMSSVT